MHCVCGLGWVGLERELRNTMVSVLTECGGGGRVGGVCA